MDLHEEILNIARMYAVVRRVTSNELAAICPFHLKEDGTPERNPSFYMSTDTGLWFCHACHEKGNLRSFLRRCGVSGQQIDAGYTPVLRQTALRIGATPDPLHVQPVSSDPLPEGLLGCFDRHVPDLLAAGFKQATLDHFEVAYDPIHQRTIYPLRDLAGQLVGLMGRNKTGVGGKYKLYDSEYRAWSLPARMHWEKGSILWHAHDSYPKLYRDTNPEPIVLVEGFKAAMWVWQAGIPYVVAPLGSHVTFTQRWILERIGAPLYLFFDNNYPGRRATVRTGDLLCRALKVFVLEYPDRLKENVEAQPDDLTEAEVALSAMNPRPYGAWSRSN